MQTAFMGHTVCYFPHHSSLLSLLIHQPKQCFSHGKTDSIILLPNYGATSVICFSNIFLNSIGTLPILIEPRLGVIESNPREDKIWSEAYPWLASCDRSYFDTSLSSELGSSLRSYALALLPRVKVKNLPDGRVYTCAVMREEERSRFSALDLNQYRERPLLR
jgi:hypothetical protein